MINRDVKVIHNLRSTLHLLLILHMVILHLLQALQGTSHIRCSFL